MMYRSAQKLTKEFLVRLIYAEMLGHDASFGYVKALELVAAGNLVEKRVGYLCASLCFAPDQPMRIMLVSRLQKDMQSANILEICFALTAAAKLITPDMIPAVLGDADKLLKHEKEIVRKKTVMLLHRFLQIAPETLAGYTDKFRRALCDKNPTVMAASLHVFDELIRADPTPFKDLVPSFVSILKQVSEGRLPRDFAYHRVPAPWIQMKLLRLLAMLGHADKKASEQMYEVLLGAMRRADSGTNVGFAIVYEAVRTITHVYPNTTLLNEAAGSISRFIASENHNLRYLGITSLASIVKDHPQYAAKHQMAVMRCLEDPDDTLKRKTLDLLYRMTNPVNVEVIVEKLLINLRDAVDVFLRQDLVDRISQVAERYAPSTAWYVQVMTQVFELGGDLVKMETASGLMRLIAEGGGEDDEEADNAMRQEVVETYLDLIDKHGMPDVLLQTLFWVLGEYGYLSESMSLPIICDKVCSLAGRAGLSKVTRGYAISSATKLTAQVGSVLPSAQTLMERYSASKDVDLAQRCGEFRILASRPDILRAVMPVDASCEDVEMEGDEGLAFLDGWVEQALAAGARPYEKPEDMVAAEAAAAAAAGGLKFEAYATPDIGPLPQDNASAAGGSLESMLQAPSTGLQAASGPWGAGGKWRKPEPAAVSPAAAPGAGMDMGLDTSGATPGGPSITTTTAGIREALGVSRAGTASGAGGPATAAVAAAAPAAPPEPTEEEKMAAALFGGIPGAAKPAAKGSSMLSRVGAGSAARQRRMRDKPVSHGGTPTSVSAIVPAPTPAPAPEPALEPVPTPAQAGGDDELDLFGDSGADATAGGAGGGGGAAASVTENGAAAATVTGMPREPATGGVVIGSDGTLSVSVAKAYRPEAVVVMLFLTNVSGSPVQHITLTPSSIPFLTPTLAPGDGVQVSAAQAGFLGIAPGATACVALSFVISNPPTSTRLGVRLDRPGAEALTVAVELPVVDLLRPALMATPDFGGKWQSAELAHAATRKLDGVAAIRNAHDMQAAFVRARHHGIQVIEAAQEGIASAHLMGIAPLSLIHGKVLAPGSITFTVKSAHPGFSAAVADAVAATITNA